MKQLPAFLIWAVALIGNVVGWVVIGDNANERHPLWVFVTCIASLSAAGYVTSKDVRFAGWGALVGIALASLLAFAF